MLAAAGFLLLLFASAASATTVDFDQLPAGTTVTNQYADLGGAGQGVVFGPLPGGLGDGLHPVVELPPAGQAHSGTQVANVATCNGCGFEFFTPRTTGTFAVPRSTVSVRVGYLGPSGLICVAIVTPNAACAEPVLRVFDASGQQVGASKPVYVNEGSGVHTLLSVSTPSAVIVGFEITGSIARDQSKRIAIDDLTFEASAPAPPDFTLTTATHTVDVPRGSITTVPIAIGRIGGSAGAVAFDVTSALPPGVHAKLEPNPANGTATVLTITADPDAPITTTTPPTITITGRPSSPTVGPATRLLSLALVVKRDCAQVSTRQELVDAIATGRKCIFVRNEAKIDLAEGGPTPGAPPGIVLYIPEGVSLEGARSSTNPGGLLYMSHKLDGIAAMLSLGANTRVTGLRLYGYNPVDTKDRQDGTSAIRIDGVDGVAVDRNEISGWPNSGVEVLAVPTVRGTAGRIRISRNYIHNNVQCGAGYGVVIGQAGYAHVDRNVFNFNRHDVADDGLPHTGYIADFNFILTGGPTCNGFYNQHFDMHGTGGNGTSHDGGTAGEYLEITRNTIRGAQSYAFLGRLTRPALELRGTPVDRAIFSGNAVAHADEAEAVRVKGAAGFLLRARGTLVVRRNRYGVDTSRELAVGDFDGDGRADVFQSVGTVWVFSPAGRREWQFLSDSNLPLDKLAFGDFDGDRKTDVFSQAGDRWRVSYGGTSPWRALPAGSNIAMKSYRFADFDGDGRTDVFRANGSRFFVSSAGATGWRPLAASALKLDKLRFGDFNGDRRADVFSFANGQWSVSFGGATGWRRLNAKRSSHLNELVFADFDGDGRTDIARSHGGRWEVSWAGATTWRLLRARPRASFVGMLFGDFDGDRRADVLQTGAVRSLGRFSAFTRYKLSGGGTGPLVIWSAEDMR